MMRGLEGKIQRKRLVMTDKNGEIKKEDEEGRKQSRWRTREGMREMINNNEDTIKKTVTTDKSG